MKFFSAMRQKVSKNQNLSLHIMLVPAVIIVLIYNYGPMFGISMAFQRFMPSEGFFNSPFVGLENFKYILQMNDTMQVVWNTLFIAVMKIIAGLLVPITFALLMNEVRKNTVKRTIQTMIYLPHFLSWIILSGVLIDILSPNNGMVNQFLGFFGIKPIFFLGNPQIFPFVMVATDVWKEFGYGTIIYMAALSGVDPSLYEAAVVDGANRWQQVFNVTLPSIRSTIVILTVLSLGNVLNAGFDQIFNLYSPMVYSSGDIIDTMVYRMGINDLLFSPAAAVGLFKSLVSFILISTSYYLAKRFADYQIF